MVTLAVNLSAQIELDLLGRWSDSTLVASRAHNNTYNEIWGLAVDNREYAVIGSTYGTHFIDVTDPYNPVEVVKVPGKAQGRSIVHRDFHNVGKYLYAVCDEGASSLQIMDITGLPDNVEILYDDDAFIDRSHNIFIDTSSMMLYSCATSGSDIGSGALALIDINDPVNPKFINYFASFGDIRAGHVHDAFVYQDTAFLNCGYDGFAIVDFSDPTDPKTIATLAPGEYPQSGYNHSGWRSNDGHYYYMADENHGAALKVVDLTVYATISADVTFNAESSDSNSIAHNPLVACDYLYVAYYYDGLRIFDISDPAAPVLTHFYPTSNISNDRRYKGAWGVYPFLPSGNILVSDMQEGLFVIESIDDCDEGDGGKVLTKITQQYSQLDILKQTVVTQNLELTNSPSGEYAIIGEDGKQMHVPLIQGNIIYIDHLAPGSYTLVSKDGYQRFVKL